MTWDDFLWIERGVFTTPAGMALVLAIVLVAAVLAFRVVCRFVRPR